MALVSAMLPVLHLVEVAFRNALYAAGVESTSARALQAGRVPCWLDAQPTILERQEAAEVADAIVRLGRSRRHTPGHLVGQLGFGFWVRLCNRPYEHGRASGPQLWPAAAKRFPGCPRPKRNRSDIGRAFGELKDYRNLMAHHQPIWDRQPLEFHQRAVDRLAWLNPTLAAVAVEQSRLQAIYAAGPDAFRDACARALTI